MTENSNKSIDNDLSKKHGIYSVVLSIFGLIIAILAPFELSLAGDQSTKSR